MSESDIYAIGFLLVVFFVLFGAAVPLAVFWYNREDARVYDGVRSRMVEELARLSMDVDELIEDLDKLRAERNGLEERVRSLEMERFVLESRVKALERERDSLMSGLNQSRNENAALHAENVRLKAAQDELKTRVNELEAELKRRGTGPLPALD